MKSPQKTAFRHQLTATGLLLVLCWSQAAGAQEASESTSETPASTSDGAAPEESPELDSIVIEGKLVEQQAPQPSTTTQVGEEELEKFEEDDVHQVLLKVPGVQVRGEDGSGLRPNIGIRGTSPNRSTKVTLMEDGILLGPAPYSAPAAYYFPQVTRMTALDVHKGGSQIKYGPRALGGAINLKTADVPMGWLGTADIAVGEFNYLKTHGRGGYGSDRTGFLLEAIHVETDGFKELDGGGNTGFDKNEVMAKWRLQSSPDADTFHRLDVKLGLSTETSNETYLGLTENDFDSTPFRRYAASQLDKMRWQRGQLQATYTVLPNDSTELNFTAYRNQFSRDWFKVDRLGGATLDDVLSNPNSAVNAPYYMVLTGQANTGGDDENLYLGDNYRWYVSQGLQGQLLHYASTGPVDHEIEAAARFHYDEVNRLHTEHGYAMTDADVSSSGRLQRTDEGPNVTTQNRGQTNALALHVVDALDWKNLTLTPGLRAELVWTQYTDHRASEFNNQRIQVGILPGMGAHYALTDSLGVLAGGYRGFGPVAPQASEEGSPERSTTWEGGARYSTPSTHLEAIGFLVDYGNLTANCSQAAGSCAPGQTGVQFDAGKVRVWGIETLAAQELNAGNFTFPLRATYSLSMSAFRTEFTSVNDAWGDVQVGDELPYVPRHQGSLGAGAKQNDLWAINATSTFVSQSRETAGFGDFEDGDSTDAYAILGISGSVRVFEKVWLYSRASNLLNSTYLVSRRPHGARPGAPRWVHFGLKIQP